MNAPRGLFLRRARRFVSAIVACSALTACDLAPTYTATKLEFPDHWEGQGVIRFAQPNDAAVRQDWWKDFGDPQLNALEERMLAANADLQAAAEAFTQSRDLAAQAAAPLMPEIDMGASGEKYKSSAHRLWRGKGASGPMYMSSEQYWASLTWEPDFWDAIRNKKRMAQQAAQERAAQYAAARLSMTAELATDYIALRGLDAQDAVYRDSIRYYELAVQITHMRLAGAISAGIDVSRAQAQLASTQAQETDLKARRDVMEHAIAVLVNTAPAAFHIAPRDDLGVADVHPSPMLPSVLLERRPDIAVAEREMAQANRAVGISRAAFYPHVTFNAMTGFMDNGFDLASLSNSLYQFGAQGLLPLFQGGTRRAELQRAWAQYRQSEDHYRSTVLDAFRDVEDGLTNMNRLRTETGQQKEAVDAALRTQSMTMQLYTGGLTNYLDVVVAQQAALVARVGLVQVTTRQHQAIVSLVRAMGGGWSASELPKPENIRPFSPLQYDGLRQPASVGNVPTPGDKPVTTDLTGARAR